jgi:ATP-dependent DNA helicase UvrD/PcrA
MTRARRRLLLTYARQRTSYGTTRPSLPSRFLAEIPPDALVRAATPRTETGDWPADDQRPVPEVAAGDAVRHKTFGPGRVLEVDGDGPRAIITVRFDGPAGTKRLALGYAPLERLSSGDERPPSRACGADQDVPAKTGPHRPAKTGQGSPAVPRE